MSTLTTKCLILAAGSHKGKNKPCSLWTLHNGKSILEWQVNCFLSITDVKKINIVVGYNYDKVVNSFPNYNFINFPNWAKTKSLGTFLHAADTTDDLLIVMYGDTIFHKETILNLKKIKADLVVAVDSKWKNRFKNRSKKDLSIAEIIHFDDKATKEYTGLLKISSNLAKWILNNKNRFSPSSSFIELIEEVKKNKFSINYIDVEGSWSEMNEPNDLVHFILGTKAETLNRLRPNLKKSFICKQYNLTYKNWKTNQNKEIENIILFFKKEPLIVRSSSSQEDNWKSSAAGLYKSILNVDSGNKNDIYRAIEEVYSSYNKKLSNDQILIQPYLKEVVISGVVFTSDINTGSPYYIINYDDYSGKTNFITSGIDNNGKTIILFKKNYKEISFLDKRLKKLIESVIEIEKVLGYDKLDIEFAIDKRGRIFTFQVRPLIHDTTLTNNQNEIEKIINDNKNEYISKIRPNSEIFGDIAIFSNMADWNPAEIIGKNPNNLAKSLYQYLFTDESWSRQRSEAGYRDIVNTPLLHSFFNQPYIDCRASLNSFIPASVDDKTAKKIVNAYLNLLKNKPHLHDKIEFDVAFTIWLPSFYNEANKRFKNLNLNRYEINNFGQKLKKLTIEYISSFKGFEESINKLNLSLKRIATSQNNELQKAIELIESCKKHGSNSFAHAARYGFIAITILKDLVKNNYLSQERMLEFQKSIPTITRMFQEDLINKKISMKQLINKFGHLRPGTYDINQKSYRENVDFFFSRNENNFNIENGSFKFTKKERESILNLTKILTPKWSFNKFIKFLTESIVSRELVKFEFTKNLSAALDNFSSYGMKKLNLNKNDISYLYLNDFHKIRSGDLNRIDLKDLIEIRKNQSEKYNNLKLPAIIKSEQDFSGFFQIKSIGNFITQNNILGDPEFIDSNNLTKNINNKIVIIPNADPGFDWIFSKKILGLITRYGGANSHMAIRCAELNIPAVIGIGDELYEKLTLDKIFIDCKNNIIKNV